MPISWFCPARGERIALCNFSELSKEKKDSYCHSSCDYYRNYVAPIADFMENRHKLYKN
jgi:hypothetical protein